jgi:hypothetical protein
MFTIIFEKTSASVSTQTKHFFQIIGTHLPNHMIYFTEDNNTFAYLCENLKFHIDKDTNSDACMA